MRHLSFGIAIAAAFLNTAARAEQPALDRPVSAPYTGDLAIFEDPKRDVNLQVDRVMDLLNIHSGSNVADIGAGSGWFSVRAARRVGANGKVYAVEINPDYVRYIRTRTTREHFKNVATILGRADDPRLPDASIDAMLFLKAYHEVASPIALLKHAHRALRPGALLGIIDRNGNGDDHGLDASRVVAELAQTGFRLKAQYDFVKADGDDYFLIFTRVAD